MSMVDVYSLKNRNFLDSVYALDTPFIRQLGRLAIHSGKEGKVLSFVMKDRISNRGEVNKRGISAANKSVLDICKLTPLVGGNGCTSLLEEVALYQAQAINFNPTKGDLRTHAETLMSDYLLSTALCYVEVAFQGEIKDKFLATRNPIIAGLLTNKMDDPKEMNRYQNGLVTTSSHYETKKLPYLKINMNKKSFSVTVPRKPMDFLTSIKITPFFFMTTFLTELTNVLQDKILQITFIKDDLYEREITTTLNPAILSKYYDDDFVRIIYTNVGNNLGRGYIKVPELGSSKYDSTGTRSINLARITSINVVESFDQRFINVDLSKVQPSFEYAINTCANVAILQKVYTDLLQQPAGGQNPHMLKKLILDEVIRAVLIRSTEGLRDLHLYMIANPGIFVNYNSGIPLDFLGMVDKSLGSAPSEAMGVDAPIRTGGVPIKPTQPEPQAQPMWGAVPVALGGTPPTQAVPAGSAPPALGSAPAVATHQPQAQSVAKGAWANQPPPSVSHQATKTLNKPPAPLI